MDLLEQMYSADVIQEPEMTLHKCSVPVLVGIFVDKKASLNIHFVLYYVNDSCEIIN